MLKLGKEGFQHLVSRIRNISGTTAHLEETYNNVTSEPNLPSAEDIFAWLNSSEGKNVAKYLSVIDGVGHGFFAPIDLRELPINNITHCVYIPEKDELVLVNPSHIFEPKAKVAEDALKKRGLRDYYHYNYLLGTLATVKSNGWKLFDTIDPTYKPEGPAITLSHEGLKWRGIILFTREKVKDRNNYAGIENPMLPIL